VGICSARRACSAFDRHASQVGQHRLPKLVGMSQSQLGRSKLKITIGSGVNRVEFSGEAAPLLHPMNWSVKDVMIQSPGSRGQHNCELPNYLPSVFPRYLGSVSCTDPRLAQVRTPDCRERSEFLRLEISNFNTHSNLIALAEYRGSQLEPDHHSPADAAGRFRTTRWSVVLLSAQIADQRRLGP